MTTIRPLNAQLAAVAENELNEVPSRISDDLEHLKLWLAKQNHINGRTDDQFLIAFLRGCKFSLERVKEKLDMYYTIRTAIPEFYSNRDSNDKKLQDCMKIGVTLPLPLLESPEASRIFLIRMGSYEPSKTSVADFMKVCYMITDLLLWTDDTTSVAGHTILVDLRGITFSHLSHFSPSLMKKMTSSIQEAYPIRQKGIHFVNPSAGFDALFKIFFSFMTDKIKKRIFVHESFEVLHKHIPKKLLPEEYGGDCGPIQKIADDWMKTLIERREWFIEDGLYKTDEKKRPGRPKHADALFGTEGSFRSLEFD